MKLNGIYSIENKYLSKNINIENGKIVYSGAFNKLSSADLSEKNTCTEFILYFKCGLFSKYVLRSDELNVSKIDFDNISAEKYMRLTFEPYTLKGNRFTASLVYTIKEDDTVCRKHIEISSDVSDSKLILEAIDLYSMPFSDKLKAWSLPEQKNSHISGFLMSVGQPVYIGSYYFGSEFPLTYNRIESGKVVVTSYVGKTLSELTSDGIYCSYKAVFGVSENDTFATVQKSFFSYIRSISKPIKLRLQYNSWYDNMLNINIQNITESFLSIDKGLTTHGTKPLDSYVMDDGWNDYAADFWCFNDKFPNGLAEFRDLSEGLGSRFGLWLGPRGGYTTDTIKFARKIEKGGNGYVNKAAHDICVGSKKYVDRTADMLLGFAKEYSLNYFKLDGFAQRACKNKKHDHRTGGFQDMYFFTDVWEKWIAFFENVYAQDKDFWINLTSYAPPSPWFLQWCNSLWMQISNDHGFEGEKSCDKDRLLTYRDNRYYDFYNIRQFQVPQYALYNHDPIYGKDAKVRMSDDEFREYLFTMAMRGTCFWELYYSHTLFNDVKWKINNSVITFIEDNMDILSNSVIFGTDPAKGGVYGYSCFGSDEGLVCLRNSTSEKKSYTLVLDEKIGVEKGLSDAGVTMVLPYCADQNNEAYSYGDSMEVELDGFETKIYHYNKKQKPLVLSHIKAVGKNTLDASFNQFVDCRNINCKENEIVSTEILEDYMTVRISFREAFDKLNSYTLCNVSDILGNKTDIVADFDYYEGNLVTEGIFGTGDFTIQCEKGIAPDSNAFVQQDEISLSADTDGYVRFAIGADSVTSRRSAENGEAITAVRERNGVMKIYLGKKLDAGCRSANTFLSGKKADCDNKEVKAYNRAFAFDEI